MKEWWTAAHALHMRAQETRVRPAAWRIYGCFFTWRHKSESHALKLSGQKVWQRKITPPPPNSDTPVLPSLSQTTNCIYQTPPNPIIEAPQFSASVLNVTLPLPTESGCLMINCRGFVFLCFQPRAPCTLRARSRRGPRHQWNLWQVESESSTCFLRDAQRERITNMTSESVEQLQ